MKPASSLFHHLVLLRQEVRVIVVKVVPVILHTRVRIRAEEINILLEVLVQQHQLSVVDLLLDLERVPSDAAGLMGVGTLIPLLRTSPILPDGLVIG